MSTGPSRGRRCVTLGLLGLALVLPLGAARICEASGAATEVAAAADFPQSLASYADQDLGPVDRLVHRLQANPFNLAATLIFLLAIIHTFLASRFLGIAHRWEHAHAQKQQRGLVPQGALPKGARLMHFMGEVEVVFGLWAVALIIAIVLFHDWSTAVAYIGHKVNFTEALFVVVIMTLASTRPILKLSELMMSRIAGLMGGSLSAWWLTILTVGPILGSFITEPAAMTISALLLSRKFYSLEPSTRFKYATLGLLFVNISVGGTLSHFAAPPVLMVAGPWGWGMGHMLGQFGWKAVAGIVLANGLYWFAFRREFDALRERFTRRRVKEQILTHHLSRDVMDKEIDAVVADIQSSEPFVDGVAEMFDALAAKVESRLQQQYLERVLPTGVDRELAQAAFHERFAEVKLFRLRRGMPLLLPEEKRAPFLDPEWDQREDAVPLWMILVHGLFMVWTIFNAHHPALFLPGMLFFLGFAVVTAEYQNRIDLKPALLVGFFLGGLVIHGGVQGWWIEPVLGSLSEAPLMLTATVLTAFNDNAAITYLSTLVPGFTDSLKYAVVAGALTGGGLTVIANAPNPAGQSILKGHFDGGVSPVGLLKGSLLPTILLLGVFLAFSV